MTATEGRVQSLLHDGEHVQDVLDVVQIKVTELRYQVDTYPQEVQTLQATLEDTRAEVLDLRTRLSESERREMSLITRNMPPRRMNRDAIERLVVERVAIALAQHEANRVNVARARATRPARGVAGGNAAPEVHGCTYQSFLNYNPHTFSETEGAVGFSRWFEKLESVFQISNCADENRVKFATCTLQGRILTWWNGYVQTVGIDAASPTPYIELEEMMTVDINEADDTAYGVSIAHTQGYKAASPTVEDFENSSKMMENQKNVKSISDKGYHTVPPHYTGNYIPPKPDLMFIDEQVESESVDVVSNVSSSTVRTVESKVKSVDIKNKGVYNTVETKHAKKNRFSPPIIKDGNFDNESEVEFEPKVEVKTVRPNIEKIKFVKTAREKVKKVETPKQHKNYCWDFTLRDDIYIITIIYRSLIHED
nr:reverse transcriptase domain-containing protein [Tanacetum cinerariifolium]